MNIDDFGAPKGDPCETSRLISLLGELDSVSTRENAAMALAEQRDPRAVAALIARLDDEDRCVVHSAAKALGAIGDLRALPPLLLLLARLEWWARRAAASALADFDDMRALNALIDGLTDDHWIVRRACVEGLDRYGIHVPRDPRGDCGRLTLEDLARLRSALTRRARC